MEAVHFRVFPSQIKRRANLYSSWKVLIAWEAKRHFCVFADGVRRNGRVRGVRYLSQPSSLYVFFTVKKSPSGFCTRQEFWINPDYIRRQVKQLTKHTS